MHDDPLRTVRALVCWSLASAAFWAVLFVLARRLLGG